MGPLDKLELAKNKLRILGYNCRFWNDYVVLGILNVKNTNGIDPNRVYKLYDYNHGKLLKLPTNCYGVVLNSFFVVTYGYTDDIRKFVQVYTFKDGIPSKTLTNTDGFELVSEFKGDGLDSKLLILRKNSIDSNSNEYYILNGSGDYILITLAKSILDLWCANDRVYIKHSEDGLVYITGTAFSCRAKKYGKRSKPYIIGEDLSIK